MDPALRIIADALLEAAGLADIHDVAGLVEHAVDAGRIRQVLDEGLDQVGAGLAYRIAAAAVPVDCGEGIRRRGDLVVADVLVIVHRSVVDEAGNVVGRTLCALPVTNRAGRRLAAHSAIPVTSGVSHARCCPPSSAII
jgi:hypothetical protein